jgi:hypothetical protein
MYYGTYRNFLDEDIIYNSSIHRKKTPDILCLLWSYDTYSTVIRIQDPGHFRAISGTT